MGKRYLITELSREVPVGRDNAAFTMCGDLPAVDALEVDGVAHGVPFHSNGTVTRSTVIRMADEGEPEYGPTDDRPCTTCLAVWPEPHAEDCENAPELADSTQAGPVEKGEPDPPAPRVLTCDWAKGCRGAVTHLDAKGWVYCTAHGGQRRSGGQPCRKLTPGELARLQAGEALGRILVPRRRGSPVARRTWAEPSLEDWVAGAVLVGWLVLVWVCS